VPDDEVPLVEPPESFALGELGELVYLHRGQAQELAGGLAFVEVFVVEHPRGGIGEQTLGKSTCFRPEGLPRRGLKRRWTMIRLASPEAGESVQWACMRTRRAGWAVVEGFGGCCVIDHPAGYPHAIGVA
jgi:hypothetical protein